MRNKRLGYAIGCAVILAPSLAFAQANSAAEALFNSGRDAMAKGDYERACKQLRESNRLEAAVGTQFNLADCEEKRGKLATAWTLFRGVEQKVPEGDERARVANERAQALEGRLPKVTLRLSAGAPNDTSVRDGDVDLGSASFGVPLPLDPGAHEFVVSAPGRTLRKFSVTLAEGESRDVDLSPGNASSGAPAGATAGAADIGKPTKGSNTTGLGLAIGGVGVVGLGVGAVAGAMVLGKKNTADEQCPNKQCTQEGLDAVDSARTLKTVSNIGWIVGVVGVGVGAYFVLSSDGSAPTTTVGLAPTPTGGQLSVSRVW